MRKFQKKAIEELNLDLSPIMGLFVALVPFLIMGSAWIMMGGVDVQVPSAAQGSVAPNKEQDAEKAKEVWLEFDVKENQVLVKAYRANFVDEVKEIHGSFSISEISKLREFLDFIIQKNYKFGPALFHASGGTSYQQAMSVLSVIRSNKSIPNIVMAAGVVQ